MVLNVLIDICMQTNVLSRMINILKAPGFTHVYLGHFKKSQVSDNKLSGFLKIWEMNSVALF